MRPVVELGHGITLRTADEYGELFGLDRHESLQMMDMLGVPMFCAKDQFWVSHTTVQVAVIELLSKPGGPSLWGPGNTVEKPNIKWRTSLTEDDLDLNRVLSFIFAGGRLDMLEPDTKYARRVRRSFEAIRSRVARAHAVYADRIVQYAEANKVFDRLPAPPGPVYTPEERPLV